MAAKEEKPSKPEPATRPSNGDKGSPELQQVQELYDLMVEEGLDSLELKDEESHIRLSRRLAMPVTTVAAVPHPPVRTHAHDGTAARPAPAAPVPEPPSIQAPLAGVFYRASGPASSTFVKEGDVAEIGQTLCIVEAMKVMNEIKAEARCRILRIVAENGRPVSAGQPLFLVEPA